MPPDLESFRANYSQREKERLERLGQGRIGGFFVGRNFDKVHHSLATPVNCRM